MRPTVLLCALAAGLATPAPAAVASHETAYCGFTAGSLAVTTPEQVEGTAYGYVVAPGDLVSIRCEVRVNGAAVSATPTSAVTPTVAVVAGHVGFDTSQAVTIELCAVYTTAHGTRTGCRDLTRQQVPPQEVFDAVDAATGAVDAATCATIGELAPDAGPVSVDPEGDVYVFGDRQWDCPPYGSRR